MNDFLMQEKKQISEWFNMRGGVKSRFEIVKKINEFFINENTLVSKMLEIKTSLENPPELIVYTKAQKEVLDTYLKQIDAFLASYQSLEFVDKVMNDSPDGVMQSLDEIMASKSFEQYIGALKVLAHAQKNVDAVLSKVHPMLGQYSIRPAQHIARYTLQLSDKTFSSDYARSCFAKAQLIASGFNAELGQKDAAQWALNHIQAANPKDMQILALRNMLAVNFNNPLPKDPNTQMIVKYQAGYINAILSHAYSDLFTVKSNNQLEILASTHDYELINKALGLDIYLAGAAFEFEFDFEKLNAAYLQALYDKDHNLLWLVLKSAKPIDATFTVQQKIETYIALAHEFKMAHIGDKEKYFQAAGLAKAAFAMVATYPECQSQVNKAFGSASELGQWIIKKYKDHNIELSEQVKLLEILSKYETVDLNHKNKYGFDFTTMPEDQKKIIKASISSVFVGVEGDLEARDEGNGFKVKARSNKKNVPKALILTQLRDALLVLKKQGVDVNLIHPDKKTAAQEAILLLQAKEAALVYKSELNSNVSINPYLANEPNDLSIAQTTLREPSSSASSSSLGGSLTVDHSDLTMTPSPSNMSSPSPIPDSSMSMDVSSEPPPLLSQLPAIKVLQDKLDLSQNQLAKKEQALNIEKATLSLMSEQLEFQIGDLQTVLAKLRDENQELKGELSVAQQELQQVQGLNADLTQVQSSVQKLAIELKANRDLLTVKDLDIKNANSDIDSFKSQVKAFNEEKGVLQGENGSLRQELIELKRKLIESHHLLKSNERVLDAAQGKNKELTTQLLDVEAALKVTQSEMVKQAANLKAAQSLSDKQQLTIGKHESENVALSGQLEIVTSLNSNLNNRLQEAEQSSFEKDSRIEAQNKELQSFRQQLQIAQAGIVQKDAAYQVLQADAAQWFGELEQAQQRLGVLQTENEQLHGVANQFAIELSEMKLSLMEQLGEFKMRLTDEGCQTLRHQIKDATNEDELKPVQATMVILNKVNELISTVVEELRVRDRWYTSGPAKKIAAIETAFKGLTIDEKVQLLDLNEDQINETLKRKDASHLGVLLQAISQNRSLIGINEATSVADFKSKLKEMQKPDAPMNNPAGPRSN